jgi:large subunit ribosomal protein L17
MRHRVAGRHLGRTSAQRRALFRNLVRELYLHERIITTEAKARSIRSDAERLITKAKKGVSDRRLPRACTAAGRGLLER